MSKADSPRVNKKIYADKVRVIDDDGNQSGIMTVPEALDLASKAGLDLVEVAPKANPPVCRIMNFGKFKYEKKKKAVEAKKRQTVITVKEIKFRPVTDQHDYDFKLRHVRRFLAEGNKCKITIRFKGREITYADKGFELIQRVLEDLQDECLVEVLPKQEGRFLFMILAPKPKGK